MLRSQPAGMASALDRGSAIASSAHGNPKEGPRPKLLFLSQCLPYPPHSGVTNRTFNIARELQREFDVTLLAFSRRNHQANRSMRVAAREALSRELSEVLEPVPLFSEAGKLAQAWVHLRSMLQGEPYTWSEYGAREFGAQLRTWLRHNQPALVHIDSLDLYRWLGDLGPIPVACTHHSVESELLELRARHYGNRLAAAYLRLQAGRVAAVERRLCGRFATNVMMSEVDAGRLQALVPSARTVVAPNGVDTTYFAPSPTRRYVPGRVVFLGPTYMFPNQDGLGYFLAECWGAVRHAIPHATLHHVGKVSAEDRRRFEAYPGVTCLGYVPDVRPHLLGAECSIVPLRVGGGTRLKILDAWAVGAAVVSTSLGAEGLQVREGTNILIGDTAERFAASVITVLREPAIRDALGAAARATVLEQYDWKAIGARLSAEYKQIIAASRIPT
jgi:glycosyltransferase involved in cell wall biosynthesis